ncbi:unnamed protein product, partial [Effrenium voratum]
MGGLVDETAHRGLIVTFLEFPCLVVYTYAAGAFALYFFWTCRQSVQNTLVLRNAAIKKQDDLGQACVQCITDSQNRVIEFEGYKYSRLGRLVSLLVPLNTAALLTLFVVVLFDYYYGCLWEWPDHLCYVGTFPLFGSFDTNSYVFLLIWCLGVAWFFLLIDNSGGQSVKLFGLRAPFRKATVICVYVEERQETISSGYSRTLALRKYLLKVAMKVLRRKELPGGFLSLSGTSSQTLPLKYDSVSNMHYVEFRCQRYIYDSENDGFTQHDPSSSLRKGQDAFTELQQGGGLRSRGTSSPGNFPTVEEMYRSAGPNQIPFEVDSWTQALTEEFCTFFFLYQFAIYAVCAWFSYWHYTIIAVSIAVSSGFFNASVRLASQKSIKSMMEQNLKTRVLRDGQVMEVDAGDLVPGDVVKVESGPVPCDLLLLKGAAVCDESTLTGESMPVQRLAPVERLPDDPPGMRFPTKHVLVAGTTVLQAVDDDTWALATHTGIHTQKGQLLLLILYPPKLIFKYDEQLSVVFFLLIAYALLISVTLMRVMYMRYAQDQKLPLTATWASAVFTCSCVLPTMLHIVLSVGQVMSAQRLRDESSIFCVVPKRIALAGKVRVACFDKTGTLTTSGLEFFGVHCLQSSGKGSGPFSSGRVQGNGTAPSLEDAPRPGDWDLEVLCGLACAHSLSPFAGTETGVVGNAVEVNMFQASGWTLSSATRVQGAFANQPHEVEITKRFDFSHSTMTMSAIVQHKPSKERGIYVKGSFEHVLRLCRPESVPENFPQVAAAHAYSGMYVLALAARPLKAEEKVETRAEAEKGLSLLGFTARGPGPRRESHLSHVFSVMGMLLLNSFFLEVAWAYITSQEEYTPFPVHKVRITQWWKLNTNWEVTTLFFSYTFQLFWSAVVYSFGDVFRLAWHRNLALVSVSLGFLTYLMLSGPTSLTRFFRLVFEDITDSDPWTEHEYCPAMPRKVRLHLLCVIMINLACTAFLEKVIIQGRVGDFMRVLGRALSKHVFQFENTSGRGLEAWYSKNRSIGGTGSVQREAYSWPVLQSGKDLVGVAKTGSGKTLAFLLPGFVKLRKLKKSQEVDTKRGPALLCITPTRELCHQIFEDTEKFGQPVQITAACAYGGANRRDQEWAIQQGPDCLIATPGRLNDFVQKKQIWLDQVRFAIIDEADRMLDMGFEPQIKQILDEVPWSERQTCMFTATWPQECRKLAETYIRDPVQIQIGSGDITTNKNITQHVKMVDGEGDKIGVLKEILKGLPEGGNCLVFCNSKKKCGNVCWDLEGDTELGMKAIELHGDLDQKQRDKALYSFKSGEVRVLVATDLASRGLDVRNIAVVVNFDAPRTAEDYVHRIGRTGRAEDSGEAYTLLMKWGNESEAKHIASIMRKADKAVPDEVQELEKQGGDDWKKDDSWGKDDNKSWDKNEKSNDWGKSDSWSKDDWSKDKGKDDWWKKDDGGKNDGGKKDDWWNKKEDNNDSKNWWDKGSNGGWKRSAGDHEDEPASKAQRSTHEVRDLIARGEGNSVK